MRERTEVSEGGRETEPQRAERCEESLHRRTAPDECRARQVPGLGLEGLDVRGLAGRRERERTDLDKPRALGGTSRDEAPAHQNTEIVLRWQLRSSLALPTKHLFPS